MLLSLADPIYLALFGITAYDLAARGLHLWAALLAPAGIVFLDSAWAAAFLLLLAVSGCAGYLHRQLQAREIFFPGSV